ncbi:dihydroneopterin aldolase [Clostridium formicaceticum]|uniref:7,8-dihydroneopterin aldolase n=1 Tax=Clostridium formicaceticum TaxID=1497 RepID=A0AAC9RJK4_9CLOT|nr:dihydroneopterin aldolase [Clostridium formicaceticum]AOY76314.1 dihydroneopterin aldolase [Clostridium formicaceticum]ARE86702.1 Dihydroneopterin aldolase [Clostridium formicaceticum]
MDKILLKNLGFYGYHGVLPEENVLGQKFFLDIELYVDLKTAGISDNVEDTVNYAEVYNIAKDIVENKRFQLIEALGESIASTVLGQFPVVKEIVITIRKPEAPVRGIYDYFGVEIRRRSNG